MSGIEEIPGDIENVKRMLFTCFEAFGDNAERFTCTEIETMAHAYRRFGWGEQAETLIAMHAEGDNGGDMHIPVYHDGYVIDVEYRDEPENPCSQECGESADSGDHGMCATCLHNALRSGWEPGK
jgi:hypothetical protein